MIFLSNKPQPTGVKKSFTLLEIMITTAIMFMIFVPMISFLTKGQKSFTKGAQIQDSLLSASALMKNLKRDLRSATTYGTGSDRFFIENESGTTIKMSFPVFSGQRLGGRPLLSKVTYEYIPDDFGGKLGRKGHVVRSLTPHANDTVTPKRDARIIAKNILSFKVYQYFIFKKEYYRLQIVGYSDKEVVGSNATVQLFSSISVRSFNSKEGNTSWVQVQKNRPSLK